MWHMRTNYGFVLFIFLEYYSQHGVGWNETTAMVLLQVQEQTHHTPYCNRMIHWAPDDQVSLWQLETVIYLSSIKYWYVFQK